MKKRALFLGLTTIDIQYFVNEFPFPDVKIKSAPPNILVGGPATNAAVAFSFLGGEAFLASAVGENPFKSMVQDDFQATEVNHMDLAGKIEYHPVLATVVTSKKDGGRNIFTHNPDDLNSVIEPSELLDASKPDIIMSDGFYPRFSLAVLELAKARRIPIVLDCGSWKPQFYSILPLADYVACSHDFLPPGCSNSSEVIRFLRNSGVKHAAITRGRNSIRWEKDEQIAEIEIRKNNVADTLGAGDFFHGALTFYLSLQNSFEESLHRASLLASETCRYRGTREWIKFVDQDLLFTKKP